MRLWIISALALTLGLSGLLWATGFAGLLHAWLTMQSQQAEWQDKGIWLADYQISIEAQPIPDIGQDLSGLTYSAATGTLFAVTDRPSAVIELSPEGQLLRQIPLKGALDPEGVTHVAGNRFIIADEATHRLSWVEITDQTKALDIADAPFVTIDLAPLHNSGIEGISWDETNARLLTAHEMFPVRVLSVSGLDTVLNGGRLALEIKNWAPAVGGSSFMAAELSSLTFHEATGNLLLLSHVNAALFEYAPSGQLVSFLPLWKRIAGLSRAIPQAEGVAINSAGDIFVISEPNLFYRFKRQRPAPWSKTAGGTE